MFARVDAFIIHGSIVLIEAVFISVNFRLETAAMVAKSDIAATRLRYEQQVYNLQTELNSLQVNYILNLCSLRTVLTFSDFYAETMRTFQTR